MLNSLNFIDSKSNNVSYTIDDSSSVINLQNYPVQTINCQLEGKLSTITFRFIDNNCFLDFSIEDTYIMTGVLIPENSFIPIYPITTNGFFRYGGGDHTTLNKTSFILYTKMEVILNNSLNFNNDNTLLNLIYPVGVYYTQYSSNTGIFNNNEKPEIMFGGTWELQFNADSIFFRTEGENSEENRNQESGIQSDCIRNITGSVEFRGTNGKVIDTLYLPAESFYAERTSGSYRGSPDGENVPDRDNKLIFDASRVVPVGSENRPVNRLIRIWKRTE